MSDLLYMGKQTNLLLSRVLLTWAVHLEALKIYPKKLKFSLWIEILTPALTLLTIRISCMAYKQLRTLHTLEVS